MGIRRLIDCQLSLTEPPPKSPGLPDSVEIPLADGPADMHAWLSPVGCACAVKKRVGEVAMRRWMLGLLFVVPLIVLVLTAGPDIAN